MTIILSLFLNLFLYYFTSATISQDKCSVFSKQFWYDKININQTIDTSEGIGKIPAKFGEYPHAVLLGYENLETGEISWEGCGGSLISNQFVLTLASCAQNKQKHPVKYVRLGENKTKPSEIDFLLQEFNVTEVFIYPGYKPPSTYHDISLLRLDRRVTFNKYTRPACLYSEFTNPLNVEISTIGWDSKGESLQKVHTNLFTHRECSQYYNTSKKLEYGILDKLMVCAGSRNNASKNMCLGDSGGPLQLFNQDKNIYVIIGITSFDNDCGIAPTVYTRIAAYVPWIENIIWHCEDSNLTPLEIDFLITATNAAPKPLCKQEVKEIINQDTIEETTLIDTII